MNFNTRTSRTPLALASTALMASLLLSGCGQEADPGTKESSSAESSASSQPSQSASEKTVDQNALLETNDKLSEELGDAYVQGWIEDGKLHVSTTDEARKNTIEQAGAVSHVVDFSREELREAINKIMRWQGQQQNPINSAIHAYMLNPETGGITLSVDKGQLDKVKELIAADKPIGDIPIDYKGSSGILSPAATQ